MHSLLHLARPAQQPSIPENHIHVTAAGTSVCNDDLASAYYRAALNLAADLISRGATPAHIRAFTIYAPDIDLFLATLPRIDLLHREALAGNFGEETVLCKGDALRLEAHAVIPPVDDRPVYRDYDLKTLNIQYSPRSHVPETPLIMARWRIEGAEHQAFWRSEEISYGPDPAHCMDLYRPEGQSVPPIHVFVHGGYWQALDKGDNAHIVRKLVENGVAVFCLNYPLCPPCDVADCLDACRMAVRHILLNAREIGVDPDRLTVSGHSAGGHLAAMLASTDWSRLDPDLPADSINAALCISGLFDLEPLRHTSLNTALKLSEESARWLSPIHCPLTSSGRMIVAVGGAESDEFRRQSQEYVASRATSQSRVDYLEIPERNHFTVLDNLAEDDSMLLKAVLDLIR